ncbi:hypothetical protein AABB24_008139 [Solanum stoloniferum]|uniref:Uncharacterized protein n=1 Tax=Solanum stoloniferum TaxID=62892 RepID=A0ABD2UT31_9SOLN
MGFNNFECQIQIFGSPNFAYIRDVLPHSKIMDERPKVIHKTGKNPRIAQKKQKSQPLQVLLEFEFFFLVLRFSVLTLSLEEVLSWNLDVEALVCCPRKEKQLIAA